MITCSQVGNTLPTIKGMTLDFSSKENILTSLQKIEHARWDYLDNYRDHNRRRYRNYTIQDFTRETLTQLGHNNHVHKAHDYIKQYNKYKKALPTAGVIMYHTTTTGAIYFVVVKIKNAQIWSMPKGKADAEDNGLHQTAIREYKEETGIDTEEYINAESTWRTINKTRFYKIEADEMNQRFSGYNLNEISAVTWVSVEHVQEVPHFYSRQTQAVANFLNGLSI